MSDVVVTGGLGFIGAALVRRLVAMGKDVVNVDLDTYAGDARRLEDASVRTERVDVASDDIETLVGDVAPQAIVHLAAETHVTRSESDPDRFFITNVEGTRRVLDAAVEHDVERVLHVSTDEVYGPALDHPFHEGDKAPGEGRATSAYARSKAVADDLALSYSDRLDVVVVRPTNCFGPWQHPEKAIPRWTTRALSGQGLPVWGDGAYVRDWMHVDDACRALDLVLDRGESTAVYNIAPQADPMTNLEIARTIAAAAGRDADAVYLTAYDRPDHDRRYFVDAAKIRALGWSPAASLVDALTATVRWYAEHEAWWRPMVAEAEALYADAEGRGA